MSSDCMGFVCENCDNPSRQSTYFQHYDMAVLEIQKKLNILLMKCNANLLLNRCPVIREIEAEIEPGDYNENLN